MNRPQPDDYDPYCINYIKLVQDDVLLELKSQIETLPQFLKTLSPGKEDFAYAEGKWTIKEMLEHILDTERILTYRLLRISRNDQLPLQGFDEDLYAKNANSSKRNFDELMEEFTYLRKANFLLFRSLDEEQLNRRGTANGMEVTARALLFIIAGHVYHHLKIIKERYL